MKLVSSSYNNHISEGYSNVNVGRTKECPIQPGPDLPVPSAMLGWSWPQSWSPTSPFSSGRAPTEEAPQGQPKDNTCFLCQPFVEILCVFWGEKIEEGICWGGLMYDFFEGERWGYGIQLTNTMI